MQKSNEDEKKINLIKCPLPKIIYSTMNGLTTASKKSENPTNSNTYYFKKINNQSPGLPTLKSNANTKYSSSPNKTNYMNIKMNSNHNNHNSKTKINKNSNKDIKKQTLKEILNNYGLNKYYEKIIELGINDNNINSLGLMNKKTFNEFVSNLNMFPGHIIKIEQLYQHIKQINSYNKTYSNSNLKHMIENNSNNNNNNNSNNNNINYVTLSFNRNINNNNNNLNNKIYHSQSHYKYRFLNPANKTKNQNPSQIIKNNNYNNVNNNLENNKTKNDQRKVNYSNHKSLKNQKNKSKKKMNNISKTNFEFPKPVNAGRNILIKYFFKDLANYANNMSDIMNNLNNTNNNLYTNNCNSHTNITNNNINSNNKEINQDKKSHNFSSTFNLNHSPKNKNNNIPENNNNNTSDLPNITNTNNLKINTHYAKNNINIFMSNNILINPSPRTETKNEIDMNNFNTSINNNKGKKKILNKNSKNYSNDKLDKSKTIHDYQLPQSINTFMTEEYIKSINNNINRNINNNMAIRTPIALNKKENNKKINYSHNGHNVLQKTQNELSKKNSKNNINIKLKLPNVLNVMNRTDFGNSLSKSKLIEKNEQQQQQIVGGENNNNNNTNKNNGNTTNIILKKDKTVLKRKNKNDSKNNNNNQQKEKDKNTVVINSWDENEVIEKIKPIRLREREIEKNLKNNKNNSNIINKNYEEDIENKNKNKNNFIDNDHNSHNNNNSNPNLNVNINEDKNNFEKKKEKEINEDNICQKIEIIKNPSKPKENDIKDDNNAYTLEDIIYENLRLNHSFSENQKQSVYSFDLEFICRCFSLSLTILIETSKESPHITEINLEALSSSAIKYFFFNETFNDNINLLFDLFDKEVNKDINSNQISPLDKLESLLIDNDDDINYDISCLKHIKKATDEMLLKTEEEKEKTRDKNGKENFRLRTGLGDIEKDIKFIDEFFSMNSRKKHVINYQYVSDISKNVLCKELSYINEIDSELNGTNNSNINNTNFFNNSNNNINDSSKIRKNSNVIDNEEMKEIKEINEINDNNNNNLEEEEENNNIFNNDINELGINSEPNDDDIKKEINKSASNNSINIGGGGEDMNKKNELKQFDSYLKEDDKIMPLPVINENKEDNHNIENTQKNNDNVNVIDNIIVTINKSNNNNDDDNSKTNENINNNNNLEIQKKEENNKNELQKAQIVKNKNTLENQKINNNINNKVIKIDEEEEIYESDYIIDINSIDELTYYFIKRSEIFDEDFNYYIMKIAERRYIPPPEPQTIFDFMADIIILTKMEKEVIILSLIYIERLIFNTGLLLTSRNWRRILLTAMIISSKIWDDNSFENAHFSQVFANLGVSEINTLERIFLELINYKVYVKQSEYFKYLMMVKIIALKYNYNGRQIIPVSIKKNIKYQEFTEAMQNRMRKKVTLNNSAQF